MQDRIDRAALQSGEIHELKSVPAPLRIANEDFEQAQGGFGDSLRDRPLILHTYVE
jgi:hypothetical protein